MPAPAVLTGDADIRTALLERLRRRHGAEKDVAFLEEVGLCRGKVFVDVAVVNGRIHGYEIKSDRDSLRRLKGQVMLYGRVLDRASLVVGTTHLDDALGAVPQWWEIQVAELGRMGVRLKRVRPGQPNPERDSRAIVELLWLDDAMALLETRGAARGFRGRPRREVWDRVCELYNIAEISNAVRHRLKARTV